MSFTIGNKYKITLFGASHGECVGVTIEGICPGLELDFDFINKESERRKSKGLFTTERCEPDKYEIVSGLFEGKTTGGPLTCIIRNENIKSEDYKKGMLRPGHADLTSKIKYNGFNDYRGGGFFSGRMTAPLVFAGAVAKQILKEKGIETVSHILSVKNEKEVSFLDVLLDEKLKTKLKNATFPVIEKEKEFFKIIEEAKNDSVGGVCEVMVLGMPTGVGEPFFDSIESTLSKFYFSVPGIKGVEFGDGFHITQLFGSEANDEMFVEENEISELRNIKFKSNHSGGINGGISNGMPIIARVAVRPTPSIKKQQNSVNCETLKNEKISIEGRHDRGIILRIASVIESVTAMGILDLL